MPRLLIAAAITAGLLCAGAADAATNKTGRRNGAIAGAVGGAVVAGPVGLVVGGVGGAVVGSHARKGHRCHNSRGKTVACRSARRHRH